MIKPNSQTHKVLIRSNKANQIHHEISLSKSPFTNRSKIEWGLHTTPEIWSSRESDRNTQLKWSHKNLKPHQIQQSKENHRSDQATKHPKSKFRKKKKKKKSNRRTIWRCWMPPSAEIPSDQPYPCPDSASPPPSNRNKENNPSPTHTKKTAPNLSKTCPWIPEVYTKNPLKNMHQKWRGITPKDNDNESKLGRKTKIERGVMMLALVRDNWHWNRGVEAGFVSQLITFCLWRVCIYMCIKEDEALT